MRADTVGTFQLGTLLAFQPSLFHEYLVFFPRCLSVGFQKIFGLKFDVSASLGRVDTSAVDY